MSCPKIKAITNYTKYIVQKSDNIGTNEGCRGNSNQHDLNLTSGS